MTEAPEISSMSLQCNLIRALSEGTTADSTITIKIPDNKKSVSSEDDREETSISTPVVDEEDLPSKPSSIPSFGSDTRLFLSRSSIIVPRHKRRSQRDKVIRWGGSYMEAISDVDGDLSQYKENIPVEGLNHMFDSENGYMRTQFWFLAFLSFGVFFFYLTLPLIRSFMERSVTTSIDNTGSVNGLPLPVVTVCPHGSGVRCDCLLWRKLHCRYRYVEKNYEWMSRFDEYACWDNFDFNSFDLANGAPTFDCLDNDEECWEKYLLHWSVNQKQPIWKDPRCEDLYDSNITDPCGPPPHLNLDNPDLISVTTDKLFQTIIDREKSSPQGPHVTIEELIAYAYKNQTGKIFFYNSMNNPLPEEWIEYNFFDFGQLKLCAQLRPDPNSPEGRQIAPGAMNGIRIVATGLSQYTYSRLDVDRSSASIDIHINLNQNNEWNNSEDLLLEPHEFMTLGANKVIDLEYYTHHFIRYRGWGSSASQTCDATTDIPRQTCRKMLQFDTVGKQCNCSEVHSQYGLNRTLSPIMGCSFSTGTIERTCLTEKLSTMESDAVSLSVCPMQCNSMVAKVGKITSATLSDGQAAFLRNTLKNNIVGTALDKDNTLVVRLGSQTMDIYKVVEAPTTTFPELMGQIGGNIGLWCGPSFLTIVEVIEFSIIGFFYGNFHLPWKKPHNT